MAKKIILQGVVQGVCCRAYCSQYARRFMLSGSASNLSDGSVRLILDDNDENKIKDFITAIQQNPNGYSFYGKITAIDISEYNGPVHGDYVF